MYNQREVDNDRKTTVPLRFTSLIIMLRFTNEIFGQLLPNYSRYAANLNMKAVSFFYSPCIINIFEKMQSCV